MLPLGSSETRMSVQTGSKTAMGDYHLLFPPGPVLWQDQDVIVGTPHSPANAMTVTERKFHRDPTAF